VSPGVCWFHLLLILYAVLSSHAYELRDQECCWGVGLLTVKVLFPSNIVVKSSQYSQKGVLFDAVDVANTVVFLYVAYL